MSYDQYGRVSGVGYAAGQSLGNITYDNLQRETSVTYTLADSQTLADSVTYSVSGNIVSGTELGQGGAKRTFL